MPWGACTSNSARTCSVFTTGRAPDNKTLLPELLETAEVPDAAGLVENSAPL
jgi:hypothetical protein